MATNTAKAKGKKADMKPVRLELSGADHGRMARQADRWGLNYAGYVRMAVLERIEADERKEAK
jgi:hypothetical protein